MYFVNKWQMFPDGNTTLINSEKFDTLEKALEYKSLAEPFIEFDLMMGGPEVYYEIVRR